MFSVYTDCMVALIEGLDFCRMYPATLNILNYLVLSWCISVFSNLLFIHSFIHMQREAMKLESSWKKTNIQIMDLILRPHAVLKQSQAL